jgi:sphingosine kinase
MAWVSAGANFFPAALPNDGLFDLLCVDGDVGRKKSVSTLLSVETGKHFNMPHVNFTTPNIVLMTELTQDSGMVR